MNDFEIHSYFSSNHFMYNVSHSDVLLSNAIGILLKEAVLSIVLLFSIYLKILKKYLDEILFCLIYFLFA